MEKDLRVIFIIPKCCSSENDVSPIMRQAYSKCKEKLDLKTICWIREAEIRSILPLAKTDTVVIETLECQNLIDSLGDVNGARFVGPMALLGCLNDDKPIPNFPWYIYNIAMCGCVITSSSYTPEQKKYIRQKVQLMGGAYVDHLTKFCTHLVTDTVKSVKYVQAGEAGISIMTLKWVEKVWEASQSDDIHCNNATFGYLKCLPFHQLVITSTGIKSSSERQELEKNVLENGGIFSNKLKVSNTDVLIVVGSGNTSEKYQVASKLNTIECLTMAWITDSIKNGYSMPFHKYTVERQTSTPVKDKHNPNFSNISTISAIAPAQAYRSTVEQTGVSFCNDSSTFVGDAMHSAGKSIKRKANVSGDELAQLVDLLDIRKAKLAGQFLDSCGVYIAGFNTDQREIICKILNVSGATRYDDISDRITHAIIGDVSCHDVKLLRSNCQCAFVTLGWLLASIEGKRPADEENYFVNFSTDADSDRNEDGSPISKQGIKLLRSQTAKSDIKKNVIESVSDNFYKDEVNSLKNYLEHLDPDQADTLELLLKNDYQESKNEQTKNSVKAQESTLQKKPSEESEYTMDSESQPVDLFAGLKFVLYGFDEEEYNDIQKIIEDQEGLIVQANKFKGFIDYLVLPICIENECRITAGEVVNKLFLLECLSINGICSIEYYHRPLLVKNANSLKNYVVTISSYTRCERSFLKAVVTGLNGISQEQFSKNLFPEKNIIPTTHLVSADAHGKKYEAAIKWGVPVVDKDWLLESARLGYAADESQFLIGKSKVPERRPLASVHLESTPVKSFDNQMASTSKLNIQPTAGTSSCIKNPHLDKVKNTPEYYSQITPVKEIMKNYAGASTPETSPPKFPWRVKTPKTPYGNFLETDPSPPLRKQMLQYIHQFPENGPPPQRRKSTPLSEIKRNLRRKVFERDSMLSQQNFEDQQTDEVLEVDPKRDDETNNSMKENHNDYINTKLMKLEEMAAGDNSANKSRGSRAFQSTNPVRMDPELKDSQACTVGWDYDYQARDEKKPKLFMISGLESEVREKIAEEIVALGGQVSELYNYDPTCTHLLCAKPSRNEKILSCMASGKWILHYSYIADSVKAGHFVYEDEYEFGNPKFQVKGVSDGNKNVIHFWRKEITRRGYGAFHDVRAIVVASKREPLVKVLEAGGGTVLDLRPPFDDITNITHCLLEPRFIKDFTPYYSLAEKGIYCVNTLFINDFLNRKEIKDSILPNFQKFY